MQKEIEKIEFLSGGSKQKWNEAVRWKLKRSSQEVGKDRISQGQITEEKRKKNAKRISSATPLGSACCHGNSSEARRAADRQVRSILNSASLYYSHPDINGQLILVLVSFLLFFLSLMIKKDLQKQNKGDFKQGF